MTFNRVGPFLARFLLFWLLQTISLLVTAALVTGMNFSGADSLQQILAAVEAALLLGILNFAIRPVLVRLTLPISVVTLGLFSLVINAVILWLTAAIFCPTLISPAHLPAVIGANALALVNTFVIRMLGINDDDSFFIDWMEKSNQPSVKERALKFARVGDARD